MTATTPPCIRLSKKNKKQKHLASRWCFSMDGDTESTNTSIEDKTEDFCDNPTRDALAEGLMCLLKPTIDSLDERVRATRQVVECLR
jgi:hypothetical protein